MLNNSTIIVYSIKFSWVNCQSCMKDFISSVKYALTKIYIFILGVFKTVAELLQKDTVPIFSFSSSFITDFNLAAKIAACCSSLGRVMVLFLMGASLLLLICNSICDTWCIWKKYLHHLGICILLKLSSVLFHFSHLTIMSRGIG